MSKPKTKPAAEPKTKPVDRFVGATYYDPIRKRLMVMTHLGTVSLAGSPPVLAV